LTPFEVRRWGLPIDTVTVKDSVQTGISFGNLSFPLIDAAIAAGATLDELEKLERGGYPKRLLVLLLAWHEVRKAIELHVEDAKARAIERRMKHGS